MLDLIFISLYFVSYSFLLSRLFTLVLLLLLHTISSIYQNHYVPPKALVISLKLALSANFIKHFHL